MRALQVFLFLAVPAVAGGSDRHLDYARVIDAEPIVVSERVPVRRRVCEAPPDSLPPGDPRRAAPDASIADLIRADDRQRRPQCHTVSGFEQRDKTVGWTVTYTHGGATYVRRMKEKPGEWIRVWIRLQPG